MTDDSLNRDQLGTIDDDQRFDRSQHLEPIERLQVRRPCQVDNCGFTDSLNQGRKVDQVDESLSIASDIEFLFPKNDLGIESRLQFLNRRLTICALPDHQDNDNSDSSQRNNKIAGRTLHRLGGDCWVQPPTITHYANLRQGGLLQSHFYGTGIRSRIAPMISSLVISSASAS